LPDHALSAPEVGRFAGAAMAVGIG
jgi:hypothetical protein